MSKKSFKYVLFYILSISLAIYFTYNIVSEKVEKRCMVFNTESNMMDLRIIDNNMIDKLKFMKSIMVFHDFRKLDSNNIDQYKRWCRQIKINRDQIIIKSIEDHVEVSEKEKKEFVNKYTKLKSFCTELNEK